MLYILLGSASLGALFGLIFSLLFINFDKTWTNLISTLTLTGGGSAGFWIIFEKLKIEEPMTILSMVGSFCISFVITFIIFMIVISLIIRDKNNADILRIRDILLGQKRYLEKYYESRIDEINNGLNWEQLQKEQESLKERANELSKRENELTRRNEVAVTEYDLYQQEYEEFNKLTEGKLRIKLPENKNLVVTQEFLDLFPAYAESLSSFIHGIQSETKIFLENHETANRDELMSFLFLLCIQTEQHLFGNGHQDIRIHFRFLDADKNSFKKLIAIIGGKISNRDLTCIPYDKANMIVKSFECKRALIKSHNLKYDFAGNNRTVWTEYMTATFYNIIKEGKPCISFGISVKNKAKYKNYFNFLSFCKFEMYLQEAIEQFDEKYHIVELLYPKKDTPV